MIAIISVPLAMEAIHKHLSGARFILMDVSSRKTGKRRLKMAG